MELIQAGNDTQTIFRPHATITIDIQRRDSVNMIQKKRYPLIDPNIRPKPPIPAQIVAKLSPSLKTELNLL